MHTHTQQTMAEQEPPDKLDANERGVEVEPPLMTIQKEEEQQQQEDVSTSEKEKEQNEVVDDSADVSGATPPPSAIEWS